MISFYSQEISDLVSHYKDLVELGVSKNGKEGRRIAGAAFEQLKHDIGRLSEDYLSAFSQGADHCEQGFWAQSSDVGYLVGYTARAIKQKYRL